MAGKTSAQLTSLFVTHQRILPITLLFPMLLLVSSTLLAEDSRTSDFQRMTTHMSRGFVPEITVDRMRALDGVILLDTRSRVEFEVSHIPGARHANFSNFSLETIKNIPRDSTVITYCSVGYRSERVGEQLLKAGFKKVFNLEGSLFGWANRNLPLVDGEGKSTERVHGYSEDWGKWLTRTTVVYDHDLPGALE